MKQSASLDDGSGSLHGEMTATSVVTLKAISIVLFWALVAIFGPLPLWSRFFNPPPSDDLPDGDGACGNQRRKRKEVMQTLKRAFLAEKLCSFANSTSGGLFLALALIHLLPEASEQFEALYSEETIEKYRPAYTTAFCSYTLLLVVQRVIFSSHGHSHSGGGEHHHHHAREELDDIIEHDEQVVQLARASIAYSQHHEGDSNGGADDPHRVPLMATPIASRQASQCISTTKSVAAGYGSTSLVPRESCAQTTDGPQCCRPAGCGHASSQRSSCCHPPRRSASSSVAPSPLLPSAHDALFIPVEEEEEAMHLFQETMRNSTRRTDVIVQMAMMRGKSLDDVTDRKEGEELNTRDETESEHHHDDHDHSHHDHGHSHSGDGDREEPLYAGGHDEDAAHASSKVVTSLVLVLAFSIHGVAEGMALGVQSDPDAVGLMLIAIALHKWAEALSIGISFQKSRMPKRLCYVYIFAFSLSSPVGISLGWATSQLLPDVVTAYLLAFSTGTFLYLGASDVVVEEFAHGERNWLKLLFYSFGAVVIFVVSIFLDHDHSDAGP